MRRAVTLACMAGLGAALFSACSLDLDPTLIDSGDASVAGGTGGAAGSGGSGGSGGSAGSAGSPGGTGGGVGGISGSSGSSGAGGSGGTPVETCAGDLDCAPAGCLEGRCVNEQCVYEVCPSSTACAVRSCDTGTNVCGDATSVSFFVAQIPAGQALGCNNNPSLCMAIMGDFVIVGTSDGGLVAWNVSNPLSPQRVDVQTPPFSITRLVSSEGRVLIVGPSTAGKMSLAWIDLPSDPQTMNLGSTSVAVNFADGISVAYPSLPGSFLLVKNDPAEFYPSLHLVPPVQNNSTISLFASSGIPSEARVVASSGSRLVTFRTEVDVGNNFVPRFSLETNAGKPSAQNAGEQSLHAETGHIPTAASAHVFTSGFDGAVLWATNRIVDVVIDPYAGTTARMADALMFRWPLLSGEATFHGTRVVELTTFSPISYNGNVSGPSAQVSDTVALTSHVSAASTSQATVRAVERTDDTLALLPGSFTVPAAPAAIGMAASRRFGFVLTPTGTTDTALYVFAPTCSN
jgi:hypothetical protein